MEYTSYVFGWKSLKNMSKESMLFNVSCSRKELHVNELHFIKIPITPFKIK